MYIKSACTDDIFDVIGRNSYKSYKFLKTTINKSKMELELFIYKNWSIYSGMYVEKAQPNLQQSM